MNPLLVVGLGNLLMGDDGVGCRVAERLASDPRLPPGVDVICGGTDLLRCTDEVERRNRVIIIDAVQDDGPVGHVGPVPDLPSQDLAQDHAHHLSAALAIELLKLTSQASFTVLGVTIASAEAQPELSPELSARMPAILDRVLEELK